MATLPYVTWFFIPFETAYGRAAYFTGSLIGSEKHDDTNALMSPLVRISTRHQPLNGPLRPLRSLVTNPLVNSNSGLTSAPRSSLATAASDQPDVIGASGVHRSQHGARICSRRNTPAAGEGRRNAFPRLAIVAA